MKPLKQQQWANSNDRFKNRDCMRPQKLHNNQLYNLDKSIPQGQDRTIRNGQSTTHHEIHDRQLRF